MKFEINLNIGDDVIVDDTYQGTVIDICVDTDQTIYAVVQDQEGNTDSIDLKRLSFDDGSCVALVAIHDEKFYRVSAKDNAGTPMTIIVRGDASNPDKDVMERAEELGLDMDEIRDFNEPKEISEAVFEEYMKASLDKNLFVDYER